MQYTVLQLIEQLKGMPETAIISLHDVALDEIFSISSFKVVDENLAFIQFNAEITNETEK